jgi:hypothetical protein
LSQPTISAPPENGQPPKKDVKPRCPHCSARPVNVVMNFIQFGNAQAAMFFCGKCEKVISIAPLPMNPQPPKPQRSPLEI